MAETKSFLFTSESVGEGHPGTPPLPVALVSALCGVLALLEDYDTYT